MESRDKTRGMLMSVLLRRHSTSQYVQIYAIQLIQHRAWRRVAGIARDVVRKHEHDVRVRNAELAHGVVHSQRVADVSIVEPKPRRAHNDGPVVTTGVDSYTRAQRQLQRQGHGATHPP
jgi:CRISPR type IV-associated protein Csf1